jgi:hypothetical protein
MSTGDLVRLAIVIATALLLLATANSAAKSEFQQSQQSVPHDLNFYRVFYSIAVTIILVIPAFSTFILQRQSGPGKSWRNFWTCSLAAFFVHLYWAIFGMMRGDFSKIFHSPDLVSSPIPDTILTLWWLADVVLAWTLPAGIRWIRLQRGLIHVLMFFAFIVAAIPQGEGLVRGLGWTMIYVVGLTAVYRMVTREFDRHTLSGRSYILLFKLINRLILWHRLPTWLAITNLGALREELREKNLHSTADIEVSRPAGLAPVPPFDPRYLTEREPDGHFDDLQVPTMGRASSTGSATITDTMEFTQSHPGARFGRNVPLEAVHPGTDLLLTPNPRVISRELLARGEQIVEAKILNLLAAAWIQFETHDWFNHGEPPHGDEYQLGIPPGDQWHEQPMRVRRTRPDPTRDYVAERARAARDPSYRMPPPTYANAESHWWDASQIYGSNQETLQKLRYNGTQPSPDEGKLRVNEQTGLALDPNKEGVALTGFTGNWWIGLSLLHTLFTKEHNAICDRLKQAYPAWDGEQVFSVARMINAALIAKIHTIEWTPAILQHPALQIGMHANWWGLFTERVTRVLGRLSENEAFGGIPNSGVNHHGAPYCLTEEFTSVYRLHPLMPDELVVRSLQTGASVQTYRFPDGVLGDQHALKIIQDGHSFADIFYSFGRTYPGAITLHNYPNYLRKLERPDHEVIDLAAIDILRDRERGVPRYNAFRRFLHMQPIGSFDDLRNPLYPNLAAELRKVYNANPHGPDEVEKLDLLVGMLAEEPPEGFGFSDTAFRIFILMASRRLKSDRFVAADFIPEVYSPEGIAWVNDNSMIDVLLRHYPQLRPALLNIDNAFKPWNDLAVPP